MPEKRFDIFINKTLEIGIWDKRTHAEKDINIYIPNLVKATLVVEYNVITAVDEFYVKLNGVKVINDILCGNGNCKNTVKADITKIIVNGKNNFYIEFYKVFHLPRECKMVFSAYVIIEYEGSPPQIPKKMSVRILVDRVNLSSSPFGNKTLNVIVNTAWSNRTRIVSSNIDSVWSVNAGGTSCDVYWNGSKVYGFYCGIGQCSDEKKEDISLNNGSNELTVKVYKAYPNTWSSTTFISVVLNIEYVGEPPKLWISPPIPGWLTFLKYAAVIGLGIVCGFYIDKKVIRHEGRKETGRSES